MPTPGFFENAQSDNADDPWLDLLTVSHPDLPDPLRWVRDKVGVTSRGEVFTPFPFDVTPPGEGEDGPTAARITIDNVDKRMVELMRALATPPTLLIETVLRSAPDDVEMEFPPFELRVVTGDRMQLQGELVDDDDGAEPVMRWLFTPSMAPAVF